MTVAAAVLLFFRFAGCARFHTAICRSPLPAEAAQAPSGVVAKAQMRFCDKGRDCVSAPPATGAQSHNSPP